MYLVQEKQHIQRLKNILNSNLLLLILILIVVLKIIYSLNNVESKHDINTKNIIGIVTSIKVDEDKTVLNIKSKENILVYYYDKINIELGDKVK